MCYRTSIGLKFGRRDLYQRDGVHLSLKGKAVLANMIADTVRRIHRSVRTSPVVRQFRATKVTPGRTFANVVSSAKPGTRTTKEKPKGNGKG